MQKSMSGDELFKSYEYKIEVILCNKLHSNNKQEAIEAVKTWLCCEWQCDMLDMPVYVRLVDYVDVIADKIIRNL